MYDPVKIERLPVLLLDDDPDILQNLEYEVSKYADTVKFSDPESALKFFQRDKVSCIVSDLEMPTMSGLDFLKICYERDPHCQRILLTGFYELADLKNSINQAHLNNLLTKPWKKEELQSTLTYSIKINQIHRENEELRRLAWTDALTGIANHRYFWDRLEAEISRSQRYQRPLSLIMCDIDNFKKFNDQYGHPKGDEILRKVAKCLESSRRQMDTVARYGGEEFAVILPEADHEHCLLIADRYREFIIENAQLNLSFGVASYPKDANSGEDLVHLADQALLRAKRNGKNQVMSCRKL